jgi:hypothetical protein
MARSCRLRASSRRVGWEVDGSDQYLAVPNLTSRPACKTMLHCFSCERKRVQNTGTFKTHFFLLWTHGYVG